MCDAPAVAAHAQGQDVGMLDEQQRVADPVRAPILNQRALQRERVSVRHQAETTDFESRRTVRPTRLDLTDVTHLTH